MGASQATEAEPAPRGGGGPLRVLTFTSLFPSVARPRHGIFVETRLRHLVRDCGVDARVVAPVPWFPLRSTVFGPYGRYAATPRRATRANGIQVSHPRYFMLPRLGVPFQPDSMARAAAGDIAALQASGWQPAVIDSHYLYPDGVAAALLAERMKLPFVMTARGTDVNVLGHMPGPAERIRWAAQRAAAVIAVSRRLKDALIDIGVQPSKVVVLRNGVELDVFRPEAADAARHRLGLAADGRLAACVGNLVPEKGFSLAIEALRELPDLRLVIVGDGPMRRHLIALAQQLGMLPRVTLLPAMPQPDLRHVYAAADVLLLTSTREGWPNVILESLACGTPVVAVDVGGAAEMIDVPAAGRLVANREPRDFAAAVAQVLDAPPSRESVRAHAAQFDWASVSRGQLQVFRRALGIDLEGCSSTREAAPMPRFTAANFQP